MASTLLCSVLIGLVFAWRGQNSTREYLLASKQMSVFPTTMSIACSFISAITILGTPAEMYVYGTQYWAIGRLCTMFKMNIHLKCVEGFTPIYIQSQ